MIFWFTLLAGLLLLVLSFFTTGLAGFIGVILSFLSVGFSIGWKIGSKKNDGYARQKNARVSD